MEYRKIIEKQDRKVASQAEQIQELDEAAKDRNSQLERFAEAYRALKPTLDFYRAQAAGFQVERHELRKQYETELEEHKQKLLDTFEALRARYEANAKKEIAKAVKSVKANERSAEESAGHLRPAY